MIARITPYRTSPDAVPSLIEEIVAVAHARSPWPVPRTNRRAEFFFVSTSTGDALSLVIGDDRRHPDGRLEPYVHDADTEVFGVSCRVTIEGRCWHVLRPHSAKGGAGPV